MLIEFVTFPFAVAKYLDKSNSGEEGCDVVLRLRVHRITIGMS